MSDASVRMAQSLAPADPVPTPPAEEGTPPESPPAEPTFVFAEAPIGAEVKKALADMGYVEATHVQAKVLADAMAGRDLLVQSKTGSGKTTAFGVPLVERLTAGAGLPHRPRALVLLPTRELAHQVAEELTKIGRYKQTRVQAIYGGVPLARQATSLERGVDVVVGTPGRLLDHIRRKNLSLEAIETVVLDEADEMLSMGFWDDVTELIRTTPNERQTLLFSATLPYEVAKSAAHLMRDVVRIDLSGGDLTVSRIDNCILHVRSELSKPRQLLYLLEGEQPDSAIIFCNTRNETELLAKYLTQSGFVAEPLSGSFKQKERERTMARIKSGELRYMVATDIAARGIDIDDLSHVFNYALPEFSEVYLHRVGRTGRAGKRGKAVSLVDGKGLGTLTVLEREFGIAFVEVTLPPEQEVIRARSERIMKELREKAQMAELSQHLPVAQDIVADAQSAQVVAFLLKAYFNGQAAPQKAVLGQGGQETPAAPDARAPGSLIPVASAGGASEDEDAEHAGERRRRGRRRSRRTNDDGPRRLGEADADAAPWPAARATPEPGEPRGKVPFEIIDAQDLLRLPAEGPGRAAAAPTAAAGEAAPARGRSRGREQGSGRGRSRNRAPEVERVRENVAVVAVASREIQLEIAEPLAPGRCRLRINMGFDDGFKGRGAVAKKVCALAGLGEGMITELASRRDHAVLETSQEVVEMLNERVHGAPLGKKTLHLEPWKG